MVFDGGRQVRRTSFALGIGLVATSVVLAGCGGSSDNGEAKKTGPQVASDAAAALKAAGAFHVAGTVKDNGKPASIDLQIQDSDVSGTMALNGAKLDLVIVNGKAYIKGDNNFWQTNGVPSQTAALLDGRWVTAPSSASTDFKQFSATGLATELEHPSNSPIQTQVHKAKVDGKDVVVLTEKDGTEIDVAATGKPYPLRVIQKGTETGTLTFSGYGKQQAITTPPSPLDLNNAA
jgi:hypothetical protein